MRTLILLLVMSFAGASLAAPLTAEQCPGYDEASALMWRNRRPAHPGALRLARAYLTYRHEGATLAKIKYDKWAHCYAGCRIAQDVDVLTANYVAWLKEDRDLHDCDPGTHFDPEDEIATNIGASLASQAESPSACLALCKQTLRR